MLHSSSALTPPPTRAQQVTEIRNQAFGVVDALIHLDLPPDVPGDLAAALVVQAQSLAHGLGELERAIASSVRVAVVPDAVAVSSSRSMRGEARVVLELARTSLPLAGSREDEAERWLRLLTHHGRVGAALQALGLSAPPLESSAQAAAKPWADASVVDQIESAAARYAGLRGVADAQTVDVLFAVLERYGRLIDRSLYVAGTSRQALFERLVDEGSSEL